MASTAPTPAAPSIALRTLAATSTAQATTDATEQHDAHPVSTGRAQQVLHDNHVQSATQQQARSATPQLAVRANGSRTSAIPCSDRRAVNGEAGRLGRFFLDTRLGNAVGIVGLLITLGFGLFTGIASYRDMKWSEHANAVQTCASLYSIGHFSKFCNETIEDGVDATPLTRRWPTSQVVFMQPVMSGLSPAMLSTTVFCTIAAVLLGIIFSRPQMQAFPPFISNVRLEAPICLPESTCIRHVPGSKVGETIRLLEEEIAREGAENASISRPVEDPAASSSVTDGDIVEELVWKEVKQEDADSEVTSDGGSEILPRVHMIENLRWELRHVSSEEIDYHTSDKILDTRRRSASDESASSDLNPAVADYFDRKGEVSILCDCMLDLQIMYREEQEKREVLGRLGRHIPMKHDEFERAIAAKRKEVERQYNTAAEAFRVAYDTCVKLGLDPDSFGAKNKSDNPSSPRLGARDRLKVLRRQLDQLDKLEVDNKTAGTRVKAWLADTSPIEDGPPVITLPNGESYQEDKWVGV